MKKVAKKAQTGVQVSKKNMNANPNDFKFLTKKEKAGNKTVKAGKMMKSGGKMVKGKCKGGC